MTDALLVLCTCPDKAVAESLAERLVESRLAACVNIIPNLQSIYVWQGKPQSDEELLLLIKTHKTRYAELEAALCAWHPYDVPEVIALPIVAGAKAYLDWLAGNTLPS